MTSLLPTAAFVVPGVAAPVGASPPQAPAAIIRSHEASSTQQLAAREVRRYMYMRTGELLPIVDHVPATGDAILLATDESLSDQQYRLQTTVDRGRSVLRITGGSEIAVLYGVYQFAEELGIRFSLDADVIPDQKIAFALPHLDETHTPLFELRGWIRVAGLTPQPL